ncbi:MAG: molybdenum cofactor guanylyltransferase [Pyrinomonadaceae bacterium]|nr:molybdenum cofactor guanylyltransferase [Pyrinomonadaceae bacterium]
MSKFEKFTGYILAGGRSSRMGTDKAFLNIGEKTLLENALDIVKPFCAETKIVLNRSQKDRLDKIPSETPALFDIHEERGALGGVHAALSDCETEFALILAVDLPFAAKEAIERICRIALEKKEFSVFVPLQRDGRRQPLCAVYRVAESRKKAGEILLETRSASMRDLLDSLNTFQIDHSVFSEDQFLNVNTQDEYEKLRRMTGAD